MAMSKREQAAMEELQTKLRLAMAFRRTEPVEPDIPVPKYGEQTSGWQYIAYSKRVCRAGSKSHGHWRGMDGEVAAPTEMSWSQRGIPLYSTELLALKALRYAVESQAEVELEKLDRLISQVVAATKASTTADFERGARP